MNKKNKLPPVQTFQDVVVVPLVSESTGKIQVCGPVWPDWEAQTVARHCRYGKPMDQQPVVSGAVELVVKEPMIWAGSLHVHFGHYISEYASRILQSLQSSQTKPLLFGCHAHLLFQSGAIEDAPSSFLPVASWFGLTHDRIRFCTQNMRVAELDVAPQAEQIVDLHRTHVQLPVPGEYLDLLDENTLRNKLVPIRNATVFVSRAELPIRQELHGGSKYLDSVLKSLGVFIFHPEKHTLEEQLAIYAGAENLIIVEGSAVHGLQLLGRGLGSISVLNRRKNARLAAENLKPRCVEFGYIDASEAVFSFRFPGGSVRNLSQRIMIDVDLLFESFAAIGIDLSKAWSASDYRQALEDDLKSWIVEMTNISLRRWQVIGDQSGLLSSMRDLGFEDIAAFAEDYMANHRL